MDFYDDLKAILVVCAFVLILSIVMRYLNKSQKSVPTNFPTVENAKKEFERLVDITDIETLSQDEIDLRVLQLERMQNTQSHLLNLQERNTLQDRIFIFKRKSERKQGGDTSPDTIIGYERD